MSTTTIIITIGHVILFLYTRRKYVRKYKQAKQELTNVELENQSLQIQNKILEDHINAYE